jgi:glucose-1-phosphate cytidylyltransferase
MKTVILAGGLGTRLSEETAIRPKPMVEIGGNPILWHIMNLYAAHGEKDFVVAAGYKGELIKEYFYHYQLHNSDLSVDMSNGTCQLHNSRSPDWRVAVVDTGAATQTGGRLWRLRRWVLGDGNAGSTFMMTYGDGVGNVDIRALIAFHKAHGKLATVTAVRPPSRFGDLVFDGDRVAEFNEKPQTGEGWINGGFFVLEPGIFNYLDGDEVLWEREPMSRLARERQLMAFRHQGFWQPMDTLREKRLLESLWESGQAPWKVW